MKKILIIPVYLFAHAPQAMHVIKITAGMGGVFSELWPRQAQYMWFWSSIIIVHLYSYRDSNFF